VIQLSGAQLLDNYADLFKFPYDNNEESLFSLQWVYSGPDNWGTQNSVPAYLAYSPDIANGDGWGGDKGATLWVLGFYDGFLTDGRTLDKRLYSTYMLPGAEYPEITQTVYDNAGNRSEQDLVYPFMDNGGGANYAAVKKYVTGKAVDNGGNAASQRYGHDTYMLRLAEMYLIYAEAQMGNNNSTTDATALAYFNAVHTRAGLPAVSALTWQDIFEERIVEFAMEGMSWYDLVSLHYYNKSGAETIIEGQYRGIIYIEPDQFPDPTKWTITPTEWYAFKYVPDVNDGNFQLPIPAAEITQAPNLRKTPVDYYSGN
jgi:hypothetical protein